LFAFKNTENILSVFAIPIGQALEWYIITNSGLVRKVRSETNPCCGVWHCEDDASLILTRRKQQTTLEVYIIL